MAFRLTRLISTGAVWLFALVWALPLLYAIWAAVHPSAFATHFNLAAPLTLENFTRAWTAAPFARYFVNTILLVLGIMAAQFVICTLAAFALARWQFFGSGVLFALILVQLMVTPDVLMIADNCPLILPIHRDLDALREDASGAGKIGTTRRGIGPAYEDKVGRRAIRVCDLAKLEDLAPLLDRLCAHHDALRAGFNEPPVDRERLLGDLREIADFVLPYARPVWRDLDQALLQGRKMRPRDERS